MPGIDLASDSRYLGMISRLRARASLAELVGPRRRTEVDSIQWQVDPWVLGKRSIALHHQIRRAAIEDREAEEVRRAALVNARGWEALADFDNSQGSFGALINSAVGYELAGYQANATCVARSAERRLGDRPHTSLALLTSSFVQRQFLRLREYAEELEQEPNPTSFLPDAAIPAAMLQRDESLEDLVTDEDIVHLMAQSFAAQSLDQASRYFLSGDDRYLAQSRELLEIAAAGFRSAGSVREANLIANLRALIPVMVRRSTWTLLGHYFDGNELWRRYLRVLARGLGRTLRDGRSVSELWPSQLAAVEGGLLDSTASKVMRMPTSAGKTRIAELAIMHALLTDSAKRCLYIAPFRALAEEVEASLDTVLGELGFGASSIIGGPETIGVESLLASESSVLVLTPEKADLLLRVRPDLLATVSLVVLDEGHIVGDERRGSQFEVLISRLRKRLPEARFVFLSAVVPDATLEDFANWLGATGPTGTVSSSWRPAIQRLASFEWTVGGGTLRYLRSSAGQEELAAFERFLPRLMPERPFRFVNPRTGRYNTRRFPDPTNRSQLIAGLAFEFVSTGPVLIYCPQTNLAEACAKALRTRIELAALVEESVPSAFLRRNYPCAEVAAEWLGESDEITQLLRNGIGIHHGRLPDAVRRAVEDDLRNGALRVLAATSTLGQGVNLPVRTVLIHSVRRRDDEGRESRLSARDYWNIAGRAGRAGHETDGLIVHLVLNNRDREDLSYFLGRAAENVEPVYSAFLRVLIGLTQERISSSDALAELDSSMMALLMEEGEAKITETVASIGPLLRESLVGIQAERLDREIEPLVEVASHGASEIAGSIAFSDLVVFARTGLTSASCLRLKEHIQENGERVLSRLREERISQELISLVLEALAAVPEMQPERPFDGNYDDLVFEWVAGRTAPKIAENLAAATNAPFNAGMVARAIEEAAGFLFPWGISAFLQIATHVLDVELPVTISALPGLVKYGVPSPVAAWLMGFGITTRSLAMNLGNEYVRGGGEVDPAQLRKWLADQDLTALSESLGIAAQLRQELSRLLERSRRSRLAIDLRDSERFPRRGSLIVDDEPVALSTAELIAPGERLTLVRDYDAGVERNVIRVEFNGIRVGVLDPANAALLAIEMDAGLDLEAEVAPLDQQEVPSLIAIDLAEASHGVGS